MIIIRLNPIISLSRERGYVHLKFFQYISTFLYSVMRERGCRERERMECASIYVCNVYSSLTTSSIISGELEEERRCR